MQKNKKQLLGLAGLAIVAVMTAVAIALPAPGASAADGGVELNVRVAENNPSITFASPASGSEITSSSVLVKVNYSQATNLRFVLSYKDASGNAQTAEVKKYRPDNANGSYEFTLDLNDYAGYGSYKLDAYVTGNTGAEIAAPSDAITFTYKNVVIDPEPVDPGDDDDEKDPVPGEDEEGNPIIDITISDEINTVMVSLYDNHGKLIKDKDGKDIVLEYGREDIDPVTGKIRVVLPLAAIKDYCTRESEYTIVVAAYKSSSADPVYIKNIKRSCSTITPDTPNTGALLDTLNVSRVDYLMTGLIAFGAVSGFAIYLICRRNRR